MHTRQDAHFLTSYLSLFPSFPLLVSFSLSVLSPLSLNTNPKHIRAQDVSLKMRSAGNTACPLFNGSYLVTGTIWCYTVYR